MKHKSKTTEKEADVLVIYMLSSKSEKVHWAEKTNTTLCGFREMSTMRCGIKETATTRNFVLWLF